MAYHWMSETFKHRRREDTHEVAFWNGNSASEETDATHVSVTVKQEIYSTTLSFKWPEQKLDVNALEAMLRRAFDIGRNDAKREIRKILGCAQSTPD